MKKRIEYSYPSSPNAVKFGFRCGCYTVQVGGDKSETWIYKSVKAFGLLEDAREYASTLPEQWDTHTK